MNSKRIFITGGSGCIGHYIADALIEKTEHELFFLVRNKQKVKFNYRQRPGVTILEGDLGEIEHFADILKTIDIAILAANSWGGIEEVLEINVKKTLQLINLLDPQVCEKIFYFSTASILNYNHQLLPEAREYGTEYIRSKYECLSQLPNLAIASKITVLFPTLVFGGDQQKPKSHLSSGIGEVIKWIWLIRWFKADSSFHFVHAQDIAAIVHYLVEKPPENKQGNPPQYLILGNPSQQANDAFREVAHYFNKKFFGIIDVLWFSELFIFLFRAQLSPWDRFCMKYRYFIHENPVNPATFGLPVYCATLSDILRVSGIPDRQHPL